MAKPWTKDFAEGFNTAVGMLRKPRVLSLEEADDLLKRCEINLTEGPNNKISDMLVPCEMLHELLVVWKASR